MCVPAVLALAEEAAREDKPFVMNLSAPFIPQFFKDALDSTSQYWDYVIGNETEVGAYAEAHAMETKDVREIASHMAELPKKNEGRKRVVVITQGTEPTVVKVQGEEIREFGVRKLGEGEICDTNGAGYVICRLFRRLKVIMRG